jgi:hypothetical protein
MPWYLFVFVRPTSLLCNKFGWFIYVNFGGINQPWQKTLKGKGIKAAASHGSRQKRNQRDTA